MDGEALESWVLSAAPDRPFTGEKNKALKQGAHLEMMVDMQIFREVRIHNRI